MSNIESIRFVGSRIKEERLRLGIKTQADAAARFGVERETWSRYETGKLEMGREVCQRFVDTGADLSYIVAGVRLEDAKAMFKKADEATRIPDEERITRLFTALSPQSREQVLGVAHRLRELEVLLKFTHDDVKKLMSTTK